MATGNVIIGKDNTISVQIKDASGVAATVTNFYWSCITGTTNSYLILESITLMPGATGTAINVFDGGVTVGTDALICRLEVQSDTTPVVYYFNPPKRCRPCITLAGSTPYSTTNFRYSLQIV